MPRVPRRRALAGAIALFFIAAAPACGEAPAPPETVTCDRVAAPSGSDSAAGTPEAPFRTAQAVADRLQPGQTGCLREGTYFATPYVVRMPRAGRQGAPITLRSFPGERANLRGILEIPKGSDWIEITDLHLVVNPTRKPPSEVAVMSADVSFHHNTVTNGHTGICMILGNTGEWGRGVRTKIHDNVFHDCGAPERGKLDHAIYAASSEDVEIYDNVFYDNQAYAVHMYPDAHGTHIHHNVMDGNGGGVIFAGWGREASTNNLVEHNIISRSRLDHNLTEWWGEVIGTRNVARKNCLFAGRDGAISRDPEGYVATDNTVTDPHYLDADNHDYRLRPGSPCLDVVGYDVAARLRDGSEATAAAVKKAPAAGVEIVSPATKRSFRKVLRVVGSGDTATFARIELWIDGRLRTRHGRGGWAFKVRGKGMKAGRHRVTLRAYDGSGAVASDSVVVRRRRA